MQSGLLPILCVLFGVTLAQKSFENHQVWRITVETVRQSQVLETLVDQQLLDLWSHVSDSVPVLASLKDEDAPFISAKLQEHGIGYSIRSVNLQSMIDQSYSGEESSRSRAENFDLFQYNNLLQITQYLHKVVGTHQSFVNLSVIGHGIKYGLPMNVLEIDTSPGIQKKNIFIDCGIHAREWVSVSTCLYIIDMLTEKHHLPEVKAILAKYRVNILPVFNPEGYDFSWNKNRLWRKNRRENVGSFCAGVDLNRNFDIHFGEQSGHSPCSESYGGLAENSEPETKGFIEYLTSLYQLEFYFNLHAYSQFWMYPYGYTAELPANHAELERISKVATDAIQRKHGQRYIYGNIHHVIYAASGSSIDYVYDKLGVPYSFVMELRDKGEYGFLLPESLIKPTVEEAFEGISAAIRSV